MHSRPATLFLASTALLAAGASAQIQGQVASLDSADNYCFFLPPMVGGDIAANEDSAIAFCNKPNAKAPGAKTFPEGFVLTAHWATGDGWVQITGQIDPTKYSLHPCDTGGQYDIKAPVGATCAGYAHFVNVIEPEVGVYGMRCCQTKTDCDVSHSTYGVRRIYGEQYDFSGPRPDGILPQSASCVDGKLPDGSSSTNRTLPSQDPNTSTTSGPAPMPTSSNITSSTGSPVATSSTSASAQQTSTVTSPDSKNSSNAANSGSPNVLVLSATALVAAVAGLLTL
ncbi:hypothetical protein BGW38_002407 [Lunasporangiospora selenospora]|uniref:Uncharacterized protein n=1 Tax=Lunasporangiospora selenospora TaxID=979761 RepID=A0A9P6KDK5_9FUNG|nr:hypothetical protein BGW38_002407 [Lunasporangiospora selenospora]